MDIVFNVPINRVSFGQVSVNLLREARKQGHRVLLQPISQVDLGSVSDAQEFGEWVNSCIIDGNNNLDPSMKSIKLWHMVIPDEHVAYRPCYERFCHQATFLSFYEMDAPTTVELNVARRFDMAFTSSYTCEVFREAGVSARFVPLAFDHTHFSVTNKQYFSDDRIAFALLGKFENRKHHQRVIQAWTKRFGNDKRYYLQCAVFNPFFNPQMNANLIAGSMGGKRYWNVNILNWIPSNQAYNDFLNSNHIVLGMSGGEGWGLPEFHCVGIGKHAVILNAHAYKDWANDENAVLVNPLNKVPVYDGMFFKEGLAFNQGSIFSWDEEEFIAGCEAAIERYQTNPINTAGLKIQTDFTYERTLNALINEKEIPYEH